MRRSSVLNLSPQLVFPGSCLVQTRLDVASAALIINIAVITVLTAVLFRTASLPYPNLFFSQERLRLVIP
jgi:hypothetical protein